MLLLLRFCFLHISAVVVAVFSLDDVCWFLSDRYTFSFFFSKKERCILSELVHLFLGLVEVAQIEESFCIFWNERVESFPFWGEGGGNRYRRGGRFVCVSVRAQLV